jgi:CheY-like chemotaxis protein
MIANKKILIVDDDSIFIFLLKRVLSNNVEFVFQKENGLEAINFIKEQSVKKEELPDIILLDLNMPILDGWQFLDHFETIKSQLDKNIQIFIVSSSISPTDILRAKENKNVIDFIIKSEKLNQIVEVIKRYNS